MKPYYEHGGITIYHGDCREVLPTLEPVDLVLTDPPYGLGKRLSGGTWGASSAGFAWDKHAPDIASAIAKGRDAVVWGGNYFALPPSRGWLVWYKRDALPSQSSVELAWTSKDMNAKLMDHTIKRFREERTGHPTPKPLELMAWCLSFYPNAQTILDPFMGSGTTLVAAKNLGRRAIGIELEERYCEIAARRLSQGVLDLGGVA